MAKQCFVSNGSLWWSLAVSHWPFSVPCSALDEGQLYLLEFCGWRDVVRQHSRAS
jgi:hypothetical protein